MISSQINGQSISASAILVSTLCSRREPWRCRPNHKELAQIVDSPEDVETSLENRWMIW